MKLLKTTVVLLITTMCMIANAQEKGDIAVGGYLAVGSGYEYTNGGIGAKVLYNATNRIRFAAEFDSWRKIKEENSSVYNIDVYAHFLGRNSKDKRIVIYPFVGVGRETKKTSITIVANDKYIIHHNTAFLFGGGMDYKLTSKLILNTELRLHQFHVGKGGPSLIYGGSANLAVGLTYKF